MQSAQPSEALELSQARVALERGDIRQAETLCMQILAQQPDCAEALHLGSLLLFRQGEMIGAIERMMRAIELEPSRAEWLNDLGNLLAAHNQPDQAVKFFQHALMLQPDNAVIWNNLGAMRVKLGEQDLAGEAFERAVALDDTLVDAWANYANWLTAQGRQQDAAECVLRAFVAAPADGQPLVMRGMALARLGRQAEAADCYRRHLEANPDDPTALHLYHACAHDTIPSRASLDYIRAKYDDYADSFDSHQAEMDYRGPALIAAAAAALGNGLTVLDAGCGTGLAGAAIRAQCASLAGVDLSDKMLAQAKARGVYQELVQRDILEFFPDREAGFDLVIAADLLIYFGALDGFLAGARRALRPGGRLIVTLEAAQQVPDSFVLQPNGRYQHGERYIDRMLEAAGFDQIDIIPERLRTEGGIDVPCWLATARKPLA